MLFIYKDYNTEMLHGQQNINIPVGNQLDA